MPDNQSIMKAIFSMLENDVFFGDPLTRREFVAVMSPGQFVSTNLSTHNLEDLYTQWDVTNDRLDTSFLRRPLTGKISELYKEIVDARALPKKTLTADQQRRLREIGVLLEGYLPVYDKYRRIYEEIDREYRKEMDKEQPDPIVVVDLRRKRRQADEDWKDRGHKDEVRALKAEREDLVIGDPQTFWKEQVQDPFEDQKLDATKGAFYPTYFEPRVDEWARASWTMYGLTYRSDYQYSYSRSTSWGGGFGVGWGLWHFGGSGGKSESYSHDVTRVTNVRLDFEVLRVRIQRPWLNESVFTYRFWTWKNTHGFVPISDGGKLEADPPVRPLGPRGMPFLQKEMYVVRNLRIAADFKAEDETILRRHVSGGAGFGFGPFSISGSYREDTSERTFNGEYRDGVITVVQPQILAFGGSLIPRCPDPDRSLPWQADAVFEEGTRPDDLRLIQVERNRDAIWRRLEHEQHVRELESRQALQDEASGWRQALDVKLDKELRELVPMGGGSGA